MGFIQSTMDMLSSDIGMGIILWKVIVGVLIIALGIILAGFLSRKVRTIRSSLGLHENKKVGSDRLLSIIIVSISIFLALAVIGMPIVDDTWDIIRDLTARLLLVVLITVFATAIMTVFLNLVRDFILKAGDKHLQEYQLSPRLVGFIFGFVKLFLGLAILSAAMNYAELSFMVFDVILVSSMIIFMILLAFFIGYGFKDYAANLLISPYVSKHVVRIGQKIQLQGKVGEVTQITGHAAYVSFDSGYSIMIPNSIIMRKALLIKRTSTDIHRLEPLISKHTVALPSKSSGASLSLLLSFFGYDADSANVIGIMKKSKGSTETENMIIAAKELTKDEVQGAFIEWNSKYNLRSEIQSWLTQEALIILCIPSSNGDQKTKEDKYVLVAGVEEDELVILDPVMRTRGTYLINAKKLQKHLEEGRKGYTVFARRKTAAAWRINEGLYYGEISAYQSISKAFERYLRQSMRESRVVNNYISPYVDAKTAPQKKNKPEWKPSLTNGKEHDRK
ncbi:MAG: hypothetical protein ACMXYL_01035 [Candidatus Woesearchaeota archaeon]